MNLAEMLGAQMPMDMDPNQRPHPGLGAMGQSAQRQEVAGFTEDEQLQELLRKAQQMFPDWPPIAQYMWAQGQIQNFQSNKQAPKNGQLFTNPNFRMTY